MSTEKATIPEDMTVEQALAIGGALLDLQNTPGWQLFSSMLDEREEKVGRRGLRDESRSRDYYVGYMDALAELQGDVRKLIAYAMQAKALLEEQGLQSRARMSGGPGTLASE